MSHPSVLLLVAVSVAACLALSVAGGDAKCSIRSGHCQNDWVSCSGRYWSGYCAGGARRRCCIPDSLSRDSKCIVAGGHCQSDTTCVGGTYKKNLCAGNARRKCCIQSTQCGTAVDNSAKLPVGKCKHLTIVTRREWGAQTVHGLSAMQKKPAKMLFIHHEGGNDQTCCTDCASRVKTIQKSHINGRSWSDIGYNYLVGGDGKAYEGRGWAYIGAHTHGYNSIAVGICVIGNFEIERPSKAMLQTIANLIACAVDDGVLDANGFEIFGHRDAGSTVCPGQHLYDVIKKSNHFSTRKIPKYTKSCSKCVWKQFANFGKAKEI